MLFRKKIERSCTYCVHGTEIDGDKVLCVKKGVVACDQNCRRFRYDPCKRVPVKLKPLDFEKYKEEDFSL